MLLENPIDNLTIDLTRNEFKESSNLRAWDTADIYLLNYLKENGLKKDSKILIINDSFGALSTCLKDYDCTSYTDSFTSYEAIKRNHSKAIIIQDLHSLSQSFDFILMKQPKSMNYFEDLIKGLTKLSKSTTLLLTGFMVKHGTKRSSEILEKYYGKTNAQLAYKKSRILVSSFTGQVIQHKSSTKEISIDLWPYKIKNHSNLFSFDSLDIGTRFLLQNLPKGEFDSILDLGCANGILGIALKNNYNKSSITFTDDSYNALLSSEVNYKEHYDDEAKYVWDNCFQNNNGTFDLVICNPPFHQNNLVGTHIAKTMFNNAKRVLKKDGILYVVANRHLGYHVEMKKLFYNLEVITQNKKFVILQSIK